ncbi:MAG: YifB family Mg chelatase-like AAA ATPase [Phycisphaerales bacterium]|nr:YifB family Mg chelatase-like AAA ATPase [Phycisphaerales bacterium]
MLVRLHSFTLLGIEAVACEIEVNVAPKGFADAQIIGLPDAGIKESRDRIRTALYNCGYAPPNKRTLVNLAPADIRKEGPALDLPIALGMLFANEGTVPDTLGQFMIAGELALDGRIRPIKGALSMAMLAREQGMRGALVPRDNANEAGVVDGLEVIPIGSLTDAVGFLTEQLPLEPVALDLESTFRQAASYDVDFGDVRGQEFCKRALVVAAAGGHNLLMLGPPGSGKTLMAKCLPTVLPPLTLDESLETTRIWSASGKLPPGASLMATRPVRTPHHSASSAALVGGGTVPRAGEVSLAHHGVLFLDEFPEFQRSILETLRQPLEDGCVTIARSHSSVCFPAEFMLVAAMNPCPCGYFTDSRKPCKCTQPQIERYFSRISGPLIDRIDIHVTVQAVPFQDLRDKRAGTRSEQMREQVESARHIQRERFGEKSNQLNGRMGPRQVREYCRLDSAGEQMLKQAMTEMGLSARAHDKVLRLSRTIADLEAKRDVEASHLAEAIQYRQLDRQV